MGVVVVKGTDSPVVVIGTTDLSDHVTSASLTLNADDVDITAFGATAHWHAPGLRDDTFSFDMLQDFAPGKVDAVLAPLMGVAAGTLVSVTMAQGAVSASNPKYSGSCVLLEYSALDASVGDVSSISVSFGLALGGQIVRGTV